jgi:hypothetical protein
MQNIEFLLVICNKLGIDDPEKYYENMKNEKQSKCQHEFNYHGTSDVGERMYMCYKCNKSLEKRDKITSGEDKMIINPIVLAEIKEEKGEEEVIIICNKANKERENAILIQKQLKNRIDLSEFI